MADKTWKGRIKTPDTRLAALAVAALAVAIVVLTPGAAAAQCAMCRSTLASPEGQKLIAALRGGILLLLAAPFTIVGTLAVLAVRMQQRRVASATSRTAVDMGAPSLTEPASVPRAPL